MNSLTSLSSLVAGVTDVPDSEAAQSIAPEAVSLLQEAFRVFNEASSRFSTHFARLEKRIQELNVELEEANQKLRENLVEKERVESYLSTLLESLPVGVIGVDHAGRLHSSNNCASRILERESAEMAGQSVSLVLGSLESAGDIAEAVSEPLPSARSLESVYQRASDGRRRVLKILLVPTGRQEEEAAASVLLLEDVTEVRRLEQQGSRNNRLAAMGEIAMNVAHEIRNPLGSIELFASMLQHDLAKDPTNSSLASHICKGVRCIDHIVSNILQFSRPQRLAYSLLNINELMDETLVFAEHALRLKNIRIERDYSASGCEVWGDAELLQQMFLNLFLNAVQATPEGGFLGVKSLPNCKTIEIQVRDSGCGFSKDVLGKIFDPFFTTRRKGTGLGLTIVHNIVSAHEGSIEADNYTEGGALFTITLPKTKPLNSELKENE